MSESLLEDIKVVGYETNLADRLHVNTGVEASNLSGSVFPYTEGGILPNENWSTPTAGDLVVLTVLASPPHASRTIQLVKMPAELLQISTRLGLHRIISQDDVQRLAIQRSEEFSFFMAEARAFGESFLSRKDAFFSQSVRCESHKGLRSSTLDQKTGKYIGLHIDNWDSLPMHMRDKARSRLILNLGDEPRFVVFINLTVAKMMEMMSAAEGTLQRGPLTEYTGNFFSRFPLYPVTRLRVEPGEGYIAPVDNLYHDGATTGKKAADVTHSMLGHFCVKSE
jgi:hypothetical protein